ncbi:MAG TPA: proline--tRNA ligase [Acidobacteriota bacterium]
MAQERLVTEITPKSEDFSRWYLDLVRRAELADYSPVKGCMVLPPYGYALWELVQQHLDRRIRETGARNAYFPLFIPKSLLEKEAEHVEGFAPEVAWVTQGGSETLEEPLAVRPTSEAIICTMFAKWVKSWRDLPLMINQWCNVVRWEKVTRPFLRTTEFLWQEGHTVHATAAEAEAETLQMLEVYRRFVTEDLAIPVYHGPKSDAERFAGAAQTYAIEALMGDGRALQAGTSHNLGQHFARAFGIRFEDRDQQLQYAWSTSWGVSTRIVGALVMVHGDENGLVLPPKVAPTQIVIVPILAGAARGEVIEAARRILEVLRAAGLRVELDQRDEQTPGWKFAEYELRGVPLRLEVGPKDVAKRQAVLVSRLGRQKHFVPETEIPARAQALLAQIQAQMYESALERLRQGTMEVDDYQQFKELMESSRGFLLAGWDGSAEVEAQIKAETTATVRCIQGPAPADARCVVSGRPAKYLAYFAKAY